MKGYLAVTTSIILTLIVVLVALALGTRVFLARFDTENFENKRLGYFVAQSCLETALLNLASGPYSGDETISVGNYQCSILPIEIGSSSTIIKSTVSINKKITNLKLIVDNSTLETISFEELQSF